MTKTVIKENSLKEIIKGLFTIDTGFFLIALLLCGVYVNMLFSGSDLLAGGDNYTYLQLGKKNLDLNIWDESYQGLNFSLPKLIGLSFFSYILQDFSPHDAQFIILTTLYFLRYVAFYLLVKYLFKKINYWFFIPAMFLYMLNPFETLDPFSLYPLMFKAFMPLSLYLFMKYLDSDNNIINIIKISFCTLIFSSLGANFPLYASAFLPQFIFSLYFFLGTKDKFIVIKKLLVYSGVVFLIICWWFIPLNFFYVLSANKTFSTNWFMAVDLPSLWLNFRFIGQWGWYARHYLYSYYPFNLYYDLPILIVTTILPSFAVFTLIFLKVKNKYKSFFIYLTLISLVLMSGTGSPFGTIYGYLYAFLPGFKMFREPFTKFGGIYVFSVSVLLYFFLDYIGNKFSKKIYISISLFFLCCSLVSAYPLLVGEQVWNKWNGSMRTFRIKIPDYWKDFDKYASENLTNVSIISYPKVNYGAAWNWRNGFSSADDILVNFVPNSTTILRNTFSSGSLINPYIEAFYNWDHINPKYLNILGASYLLQQNDLDWRFSVLPHLNPLVVDDLLNESGLKEVQKFGMFTKKYLDKIPNDNPSLSGKFEMLYMLNDKVPLKLYEVPNEVQREKFSITNDKMLVIGGAYGLLMASEFDNFNNTSSVDVVNNLDDFETDAYSNIFVYGEPKSSLFLADRLSWNSSWIWPEANINPSTLEYFLVPLKESLEYLMSRDTKLGTIDKYNWFTAKRATEIYKYNLDDVSARKVFVKYRNLFLKTINLIQNVPEEERNVDYWNMSIMSYSYLDKTLQLLSETEIEFSQTEELSAALEEFRIWMEERANIQCTKYCYRFEIPENGIYDIYFLANESALPNELVVINQKSQVIQNIKVEKVMKKGRLYKLAQVDLEKDSIYRINLVLRDEKNLIQSKDWLSYNISDQTGNELTFNLNNLLYKNSLLKCEGNACNEDENTIMIPPDLVKYKRIDDWKSHEDYVLSIDYEYSGGGYVGVAVLEDIPDFETLYNLSNNRNDAINESLFTQEINFQEEFDKGKSSCDVLLRKCTYTKYISSSDTAVNAYIYVYILPTAGVPSTINITNTSIYRVTNPSLMLHKANDINKPKEDISGSKVSYKKVSPTKYLVSIKNAPSHYILNFNENYNSFWELKHKDVLVSAQHKENLGFKNKWEINSQELGLGVDHNFEITFKYQSLINKVFYLSILTPIILVLIYVFKVMWVYVKKNR